MKRTTALLLLLVILLTGCLTGCARKIDRLDDASGDGAKAEATENDDVPREDIPRPDYDELPSWLRESLNDYFYPEKPEDRLDEITTVEFYNPLVIYNVDAETNNDSRSCFVPCAGFNGSRVSIVPCPGRLILSERMNAYLETIDSEWKINTLQSLFVYKDPFAPELTENKKQEMLEAYPECLRNGAVYALDSETKAREMREVRTILSTFCEEILQSLSLSDPESPMDFSILRFFPNLVSVTVNATISAEGHLSEYARKAAEENGKILSIQDQDILVLRLGQEYEMSMEEQASTFGDLYDFSTFPDNVSLFFRPGASGLADAPDPVRLNPASIPSKEETDALWTGRAVELLP